MPALVCIFLSVLIFLIYVIRNDVKLLKNDFSFGSGQGVPGCSRQGRLSLRCAGSSLWWPLSCRARALGTQASVVAAPWVSNCGAWL